MDKKLREQCFDMISKSRLSENMIEEINQYLEGKRRDFTFDEKILEELNTFHGEVLKACYKIKFGEIKSYKDIAIEINRPKAYRAVGTALGNNPYPIVIPCHRVLGSDNKLHGYAGGLELKKYLLEFEKNSLQK